MDIIKEVTKIFFICLVTYLSVITIIRISGARTLSKQNSFDFIATLCLGSIMASTATNSLELHKGIIAFATIVFFQFIISKLTTKHEGFQKIFLFEPKLLFYEGEFIEETLVKERISEQEIFETIRQNGIEAFDQVKAVVLEGEGSLSVIPYSNMDDDYRSIIDDSNLNIPKPKDIKFK
ncbi:MAG TPA: YetF domain-containing protein [Alloiococcus sp.]|nr:YetF domain-containing protein [Alloiococcus sp.]